MLNWRRVLESICHGYMCIVLYMKLICCNGFQRSMLDLGGGGWVNLQLVYVHCTIYETYLVSWFSRHLCCIGGGRGRVNLPYVYVFCTIYETYLVSWISRHLCSIAGAGWGQSSMGICALCYIYIYIYIYMKLICCNGFPEIYAQLEE